ncbi:MAG: DUF3368 domain-containing protein [Chloroflexi bacterium]|nr:DUF3368 domain-containing protein [Chloroflexota bacterium]
MAVVADASPLILYARASQLELLHELFGTVWISPRVADETFRTDSERPGAAALRVVFGFWLIEQAPVDASVTEELAVWLDPGESEAIALAFEHHTLLLIDDPDGRTAADRRGVEVVGTAGITLLAKQAGFVPSVRPLFDALVMEGPRLSQGLYGEILRQAGEQPT